MAVKYLSKEEEVELVRKAQSGCIESRNAVVMNVSDLCWKYSQRFAQRNQEKAEDYHQFCIEKLIEKFSQFDLGFDTRFTTWAENWIKQACHEMLAEHMHEGVRVPRYMLNGKTRKEKYLPFVKQSKQVLSTSAKWQESDSQTVGDAIVCHRGLFSEVDVAEETAKFAAFINAVLDAMPPQFSDILRSRQRGEQLEIIGKRIGRTQERVRQLEEMAMQSFCNIAQTINPKLVRDIEATICNSNRHWAKQFLSKGSRDMDNTATVQPAKVTKASRIEQVMREMGRAAQSKEIKSILANEGFKVFDAELSNARRKIWGGGNESKSAGKKPTTLAIANHLSPAANRDIIPVNLDGFKRVKVLADEFGGLGALRDVVEFLIELQA